MVGYLVTCEGSLGGAGSRGRAGYGVGSVTLSFLHLRITVLLREAPVSHLLLGSARRDAARPQECAHYRELDDCPECDGGGGAGVLSI